MTGQELRAAREAAGLSPEQFAVRLGVSGRTIYRYETGDVPIRTVRERAIISVLDELAVPLDKVETKTPSPRLNGARRKAKRSK